MTHSPTRSLRGALLGSLVLPLFAAACSATPDDGQQGAESAVVAPSSGRATCTATFRWLQKDAYKETGGRTTDTWPAHTTTQIDVTCADAAGKQVLAKSAFDENHGTKPGALDPAGTPFLVEVKTARAEGTRAQVEALLRSYERCDCESATEFLSMEVAQRNPAFQKVLAGFIEYTAAHLVCSGDVTTADVVERLRAGDVAAAMKGMESCKWPDGFGVADGFDQAAVASLAIELPKYHVCNNDAKLQAELFERFATTGEAPPCAATSALCKGPTFFYDP